MDRDAKLRELNCLRAQVDQLERDLQEPPARPWAPKGFYTAHHVLAGFVLGMFGAATSLLVNIIGSLLVHTTPPVPDTPLRLINVYLTFPMGAAGLQVDQGLTLAIGCCLYLGTGMLLGIPFQLVLARWFSGASLAKRLAVASVIAIIVWLINFYGILAWLQPLLFGGRWIVDLVPWWVAALTHLVFGWTMALLQPLGAYPPLARAAEVR